MDHEMRAHVARIVVRGKSDSPQFTEGQPFQIDAWSRSEPIVPDSAGEYLALTFLKESGLGVVSPIQDPARKRFGFSWWRVDEEAPLR
jgi:hypothetical protein